jgi:hypothetical protein
MTPFKRKHKPHAQFHLPPLETSEALLLVEIFERAQRAIWRAHGDAMADRLACLGVDTPKPEDALWAGDATASDSIDNLSDFLDF